MAFIVRACQGLSGLIKHCQRLLTVVKHCQRLSQSVMPPLLLSCCLSAVSSDRTARLWALAGEEVECELVCKGHQRAVTAVALNDG